MGSLGVAPAPHAVPPAFLPDPVAGRIHSSTRVVRITDVTPAGRLRLDALARYLQDAAEDDVTDAGWDEGVDWLMRRCVVSLAGYPGHGDRVHVRTFCSGLGLRWAERTTTLTGADGDLIQARAIWVALDRDTGAPTALGPRFHEVYGASTGGRSVSARLSQPGPPPDATARPWPLRASDFDVAGHVNNAVHWAAVEDAIAGEDWLPARAQMEYQAAILPGSEPVLMTARSHGRMDAWLVDGGGGAGGGTRLASARLEGWPRQAAAPSAGCR
jgi:acyl-ACP thioesterase